MWKDSNGNDPLPGQTNIYDFIGGKYREQRKDEGKN